MAHGVSAPQVILADATGKPLATVFVNGTSAQVITDVESRRLLEAILTELQAIAANFAES